MAARDPLPEARRARPSRPLSRWSRSASSSGPPIPGSAAPTGRSATASSSRRSTTPRPGSSGSTGRSRRSSASRSSGSRSWRVRDHRDRRSILWPSFGAVALVGFQAWLGRETVRLGNSGESVTAHLAAAMPLVGLLVYLTVRAAYPARIGGRGASQRFTLLAAFTTAATLRAAVVRVARDRHIVGPRLPGLAADGRRRSCRPLTDVTAAHVLHRWVAALVGVFVVILAVVAWRTQRDHPTLVRLAVGSAVLFAIQVVIGGPQVLTRLADWTQTLHLALGAVIWAMLAGLTVTSYYTARVSAPATADGAGETGGRRPGRDRRAADHGRHDPRLHRADQAPDHRAAAGHDGPRDGPRHARPARRHRPGSTGPTGSRSSSGR